jgi:hypothetical protein
MKVDLHVHTRFSGDSLTTLPDLLRWAARRGLGALAITDHNTMRGAWAMQEISPIPIIAGEEIHTAEGEIIGLFLEREIAPGLTPAETIGCIRDQGGLVYVPHPLDRFRSTSAVGYHALMRFLGQVDVIEVFNARVMLNEDNRLARELALAHRLVMGAGSDAHQGYEIGHAYVEMPAFRDAVSFMNSLRQAVLIGRLSSPLVHVGSSYARAAKEFAALTTPGHPA